jgi:hypothetical protein
MVWKKKQAAICSWMTIVSFEIVVKVGWSSHCERSEAIFAFANPSLRDCFVACGSSQ